MNPKLIEKSDKDISWGESLDEQLAQACISKMLVDENHNTSSIFHYLSNRFDNEFIDEIKLQVLNFDEEISPKDEFVAIRKKIKQSKLQASNKSKLDSIKHKSFDTLTSEEKEFLKEFTKR